VHMERLVGTWCRNGRWTEGRLLHRPGLKQKRDSPKLLQTATLAASVTRQGVAADLQQNKTAAIAHTFHTVLP